MCVAAIIFNPVPLEHLECMENDNPHGAGIAWLQGEEIRFMRGLTAKDIHQMQEDKVMSYPYLMHYRWATHGDKIPQLTHPFPIGPRALMGELNGSAQAVLIHNGTWNSYEKEAAKYLNLGNYEIPEEIIAAASDTAIAAWLAQDNPSILDEVLWATATAEILETNGVKTMEITTRGTWSDKDGNWYSNLNWMPWSGYYSFPSDSLAKESATLADARSKYWEEWEKRWRRGEETDSLVYPEEPTYSNTGDDIDWDAYFLAPFSTRGAADAHLNFDTYVERFRKNKTLPPIETGASSRNEMSWDEYLVSKYGPQVAAQIKKDCFPDDDGGDELPLSLTCAYSAARDEYLDNIDPDAVSEDFETVNAILERQMRGKWGA